VCAFNLETELRNIILRRASIFAFAVQEFKAQDGLLFNAVRPGDKVVFQVFDHPNGTKTITKLNKE